MKVLKNNGQLEPLSVDKIEKSLQWACEGLNRVSASDIMMASKIHFYDGIKTKEIHKLMIKTADELSSLKLPDYDTVASRLYMSQIRMEVYGQKEAIPFGKSLVDMINSGDYDEAIALDYKLSETAELSSFIDHSKDFTFSYVGLKTLINNYSIKGKETPQMLFMALSMEAFRGYPKELKMAKVKELYTALSNNKVSLPTPIMANMRTYRKTYDSCIVLKQGDSIESWMETDKAITAHVTADAGLGVDISAISSVGDKVKKGKIIHSGKIPILHTIDKLVNRASQMGRRGSAAVTISFFDPEIQTILSLKSPKTAATDRINDLKYTIKVDKFFIELVKQGKNVKLISTRECPELYEAFHMKDRSKFNELYEAFETDRVIDARQLLERMLTERVENGVFYFLFIDEVNKNTPFTEPIYSSNLCCEIGLPTKDITDNEDPSVAVCILASINQGKVTIEELPAITDILVRLLDWNIERHQRPTKQSQAFAEQYRSLGIGFSSHAYWLAKQGFKYGSKEALTATSNWVEVMQYNLLKTSIQLAKEFGHCKAYGEGKVTPKSMIPTYRQTRKTMGMLGKVDHLDWTSLEKDIAKYGVRNTTLSAVAPVETSGKVAGMTSGIEPVRDLLTIKESSDRRDKQFVPEMSKLADKYDFAFDRNITADYLKHVAVIQAWIDQSISSNTYYNPKLNEDSKISMKLVIEDFILASDLGVKSLYYNNVKTSNNTEDATVCHNCTI